MAIADYSTNPNAPYVVISSVRPAKPGQKTLASFLFEEMQSGAFSAVDYGQIGVIAQGGEYDGTSPSREYNQFPTYEIDWAEGGRERFLTNLRAAEERFHEQHPGRA